MMMTEEAYNARQKMLKLQMKRAKNNQCISCGKSMVNAYDTILKRISEYLWKHDCDCFPDHILIGKG